MAIFIPRWERWKDKKPSGPAEINWNNPLTNGLILAVSPDNSRNDIVNNIPLAYTGSFVLKESLKNCLGYASEAASTNIRCDRTDSLIKPTEASVFIRAVKTGTASGSYPVIAGLYPNTTDVTPWASASIRLDTATGKPSFGWNNANTGLSMAPSGGVISNNMPFTLALCVGNGDVKGYEDGVEIASSTNASTISYGTTARFQVGGGVASLSNYPSTVTDIVFLFGRKLTVIENYELAQYPYQLLKPRSQFFFLGGSNETADIQITTVNPTIAIGASQLQHTDVSITTVNPTIAAELSQTLHADVAITTVNPTIAAIVNETVMLASVALTTQNPIISARITGGEPDFVLGGVPLHSEVKRGKRRWETDEEYEAEYNENVPVDNPLIKLDGSVTKIKESMDHAKKQADKKDEDDVKAIVQFVKEYRSNIISTWLN